MAQNPEIDPASGDYVLVGGAPKQTDSLKIPAYFRLKVKRQLWLYAPNSSYGSDLYQIRKRKTTQDPNFIEATAARALQPIVNDGRASAIEVDTAVSARNALGLDVLIADAQGEVDKLQIPGLGV